MSRSVSDADIQKVAKLTGVPYRILRAQVGAESGGRQVARSSKGASGVEQLMPSTARYVARKYGVNTNTPYGNLLGGAYYLKEQKQAFGNWRLALAAYNAGPGAVHTYHGVPPFAETEHYVRDILTKAGAFTNPLGGAESASPAQTPSIAPGGTAKLDTALQGLGDLAAGEYNPTKELQALQKVQESTQKPGDATQVSGTETPAIDANPSSPHDRKAVALVREYLGTPYVWGGTKPGGFDCSGLVQYVWGKQGIKVPRTTYEQWKSGHSVPKSKLRLGDTVFFHMGPNGPEHEGMYIGGGKFIEAPHTGAVVRISKLAGYPGFAGARRFA